MNLFHSIRPAEDQKQNARIPTVLFPTEIFHHVLANQLLRGAMARVSFRHNRVGIALGKLGAGSEHSPSDQIESCARNQPANDATGARFPHRVGRHDGIGELFSLHSRYLNGGQSVPQKFFYLWDTVESAVLSASGLAW